MDNQHKMIKGYRDLSQKEIDLMNEVKDVGDKLESLLIRVREHLNAPSSEAPEVVAYAQPARWLAIAQTDFQTGLMALTRSIAQPTKF